MKVGQKVKPIRKSFEKIGVTLDLNKNYTIEEISGLNDGIIISINGKIIKGKREKDGKKFEVSFDKKYFEEVKTASSCIYNKTTKYEKMDIRGSHHFYGFKG